VTLAVLLATASGAWGPGRSGGGAAVRPQVAAADGLDARAARKPNIIFFLADDMSSSLLRHMPNTRSMIFDRGARFTRFHTNISMCCPARASLLMGRYAHNTGIVGNSFPDGFHGFHTTHEPQRTVAIALRRRAGYRTSLLGKYLNEYPQVDSRPEFGVHPTYVPNGWSDWAVPIRGERDGRDYVLNLNERLVHKDGPENYLSDLLVRRVLRLIRRDGHRRGFAVLLSFNAPHTPEPASPIEKRNDALRERIAGLRHPRTPDFDEADVSDKPPVIQALPRLSRHEKRVIDRVHRRRVLSVKTLDRHVGAVVRSLRRNGELGRTYLVFSSDNGYHLGAHRLRAGKNTPYLADTRVAFAIRGPGIEPGTVVDQPTGNIDVASTFADIAGIQLHFRHDGESLLPLAKGRTPERWRRYYFIQRGIPLSLAEPSRLLERRAETPPRFVGVMGEDWQYVRYASGAQELYHLPSDPHQLENVMARPADDRTDEENQALADLRRALRELRDCFGVRDCRVR
jgi:arylsulfatase A-like enzyme